MTPLDLQDLRAKVEAVLTSRARERFDAQEAFENSYDPYGIVLDLLDGIAELEAGLEEWKLDFNAICADSSKSLARVAALESERTINHERLAANERYVAELEAQLDTEFRCQRCGRSDLKVRDIRIHVQSCLSKTDQEFRIDELTDALRELEERTAVDR